MLKVGKATSGAKKCARAGCTVAKNAKPNSETGAVGAYALPFAHRTPTQLHASTYALRRG